MQVVDIVRIQIEDEFESVTGFKLPDNDSSNTIVLNDRRFTDKDEYIYYIANRMWDTFDEELTQTDVEVGDD